MIEDGAKGYYASVPGVGFMQPKMLDRTVGKHVDNSSAFILVDQYKVTANYLKNNGYQFMTLASNVSDNANQHKPEIHEDKHLQHVNAMHSHIHRFLTQYKGVSTKYLENYLALFVWIKNAASNKQKRKIDKITMNRGGVADCYITRKGIENLPMVPYAA